MKNTTHSILSLLFFSFISLFAIKANAQMEVGSVWKLTGNAEAFLSNSGVDSTKIHFLNGGVFQISYEYNSNPLTETSSWADVDASNFKFYYDPSGMVFGSLCPDDSSFVQYSINGNQLTMNTVTGSCSTANGILTGSVWNKVGGSSAGIGEVGNGIQSVYPNPSNGEITVTLNSGVSMNDLKVTTVLGQNVPFTVHQTGKNNVVIHLIGIEKGMYYLGTGSSKLETIVVQ